MDETERLRQWKAEALVVLAQWDEVWDALGRPGGLGESRAEASKAKVLRILGRSW